MQESGTLRGEEKKERQESTIKGGGGRGTLMKAEKVNAAVSHHSARHGAALATEPNEPSGHAS